MILSELYLVVSMDYSFRSESSVNDKIYSCYEQWSQITTTKYNIITIGTKCYKRLQIRLQFWFRCVKSLGTFYVVYLYYK